MSDTEEPLQATLGTTIEAVVLFSKAKDDLDNLGVPYSLHLTLMDENDSRRHNTFMATSEPMQSMEVVETAQLCDGRKRVITSKRTNFPLDADLHPENARIITHRTHVEYFDDVSKLLTKEAE